MNSLRTRYKAKGLTEELRKAIEQAYIASKIKKTKNDSNGSDANHDEEGN